MKVTAIRCPLCKDTVYSRARHDYRSCGCQSVAIDGGQNAYFRVSYNPERTGIINTIEVDLGDEVTLQDLHRDWNESIDKLGIIKGK
jgi:hypothetical protein